MQKPAGNSCHAGQTEGGGSRRGIAVSHKEKVGEKSAISKLKAIRAEEGGYFCAGKMEEGEKLQLMADCVSGEGEKKKVKEKELGENEQLPLLLIWGVGFSFSGKFALL